jgi:hypothetical protein
VRKNTRQEKEQRAMFDRNSRYYGLPTLTLTLTATSPDGEPRDVRYVSRRFIPRDPGPVIVEHSVSQGERLDNITARYLGDPTQFWRVCDSNNILDPDELTARIGEVIRIALPSS